MTNAIPKGRPAVNTSAAWLGAALCSRALRPRARARRSSTARRLAGDRGEGVISAAIAVLIMAFLGAAMWLAFTNMWNNAQSKTCSEIGKIGSPAGGAGTPAC